MNFYKEIAGIYDKLFPVNENKINFLLESGKKSGGIDVLDVGCSNGNDAKELIKNGYNVVGVDVEEEMVERSIANGIDAEKLDMLKIDELKGNYDLIYAVGNTLSHLQEKKDVITFFEKVYSKLKNKGVFVLQIINYDKFWKDDATNGQYLGSLPEIKGEDLKFTRDYYRRDDKIGFRTTVAYKDKHMINEVLLLPLNQINLIETLVCLGFSEVEAYGSYKKTPLGDGDAVIIRCKKKIS
ncbi:MAG: class I SAM-dependent methyltransferase [Ezakiella sp.]|nr:class I SAM-dependent methyltransferase [Ezakiella sp.]MDY3923313.1 class I SAM-dependent methyltransferase [Ezakiella sp.]